MVHPNIAQKALSGGVKLHSAAEVNNSKEFAIEEAGGDGEAFLGDGLVIDACVHLGRNICKHHRDFEKISLMQRALNTMCDRLGKTVAKSGEVLLLFEAPIGGGPDIARAFALMTGVSLSPKFQDFTMCHAESGAALGEADLVLPLQLVLVLAGLPLVIPGESAVGLQHMTSSELLLSLLAQAPQWRMRICKYTLLTPMQMVVTGLEGAEQFDLLCGGHQPKAARIGQRRNAASTAAELEAVFALNDLGDPMLLGARHGAKQLGGDMQQEGTGPAPLADGPMRRRQRQRKTLPPEDPEAFGEASDLDAEAEECFEDLLEAPPLVYAELLERGADLLTQPVHNADLMAPDLALGEDDLLPQAFQEDGGNLPPAAVGAASSSGSGLARPSDASASAIESLGGVLDLVAELADIMPEEDGGNGLPPGSPVGEAPASVPEAPAADAQPEPLAPPPPRPAVGAPIADGPEGWTMDALGYIFCLEGVNRGRITGWGKSVSVRCRAHGCSKAKGRAVVTNGQLAHWLARGIAECAWTPGRDTNELKQQHIAMFRL